MSLVASVPIYYNLGLIAPTHLCQLFPFYHQLLRTCSNINNLYFPKSAWKYRQPSHISHTLVGIKIVDSWSVTCWRCSNDIFILDLKPGFNILHKDNCKTRWEIFKFWNLVHLILEIWWYMCSLSIISISTIEIHMLITLLIPKGQTQSFRTPWFQNNSHKRWYWHYYPKIPR